MTSDLSGEGTEDVSGDGVRPLWRRRIGYELHSFKWMVWRSVTRLIPAVLGMSLWLAAVLAHQLRCCAARLRMWHLNRAMRWFSRASVSIEVEPSAVRQQYEEIWRDWRDGWKRWLANYHAPIPPIGEKIYSFYQLEGDRPKEYPHWNEESLRAYIGDFRVRVEKYRHNVWNHRGDRWWKAVADATVAAAIQRHNRDRAWLIRVGRDETVQVYGDEESFTKEWLTSEDDES